MASTFDAPAGSTNHGDPNLLCVPPSWTDLAVFFGTNYLAHAATLIARPGQSLAETIVDTANALFIPGSGMIRAIRLLFFYTDLHRSSPPLQKAAKAGALCMVVRRTHVSRAMGENDDAEDGNGGDWFSRHFSLATDPVYVPLSRSILGTCIIRDRERYCLVEVSPLVPLREFMPEDAPASPTLSSASSSSAGKTESVPSVPSSVRRPKSHRIEVPGQLDIAKILVSILQLIWGISTLYNARGNQIDLYGYAAFGLTVTPYAVMSFLNLLVSLILPVHNNMYLVWTEDMRDAMENRRPHHRPPAEFAGMIATVDLEKTARIMRNELGGSRIPYDGGGPLARPVRLVAYSSFYLLVAVVPLAIVGGLTGFRTGSDVHVERAWVLAWLIIGSASAILIRQVSASVATHRRVMSLQDYILGRPDRRGKPQPPRRSISSGERGVSAWFAIFVLFPLWIPAIGGMVVVGKMLQDFGVCTRLD
ncbi:uncharacterized protein J7T55_002082 [Diaporthe amygdali]|uniref:uncharacterized protein n=1 Tax=Phomopsis amygdali TaxID=1214568 RepID=UPI0022FDFDBF|nr:uncharacterized protein J7T55_002082 [Diaporthe amygdali]KAJ0108478.1 uncharacterized protein J7T55_002082 [Diaporthe amygdali]